MPTQPTHFISQATTLLGHIVSVDEQAHTFQLCLRDQERVRVFVAEDTAFSVLTNLEGVNRDSLQTPPGFDGSLQSKIRKYLSCGHHVYVQGILVEIQNERHFDAKRISLLHPEPGKFLFEETHWWLTQIDRMADQWLVDLFGDQRNFEASDFSAMYRTNMGIHGQPTDNSIQQVATLARLIYGLSSAYLLRGKPEYFEAAKAGVAYQRGVFRDMSNQTDYCFWYYGRKKHANGSINILPSQNTFDFGSVALYEQIYAIAGLTQFYRITGDPDVLQDIRRTVAMFDQFFLDDKSICDDYPGHGGYFSNVDPANMRADSPTLGRNMLRKNWNSIGDHIPAYLINVILALDPLPVGCGQEIEMFLDQCRDLLGRCTDLILEKFPDPDSSVPYVRERFYADWTPDLEWGWQQDRAIVGHNLKIAWNLTRVANYYTISDPERAKKAIALAERLAQNMIRHGLDLPRGGCFDAVERHPGNVPIKFVWGNTKDFWQQEQGILAYLILYGHTGAQQYLDLARDMSAFWNQFFLDRANVGVWFRVSESGVPIVEGDYVNKATEAVAGYHSFELNFLAHIYTRLHLSGVSDGDDSFCLFFRPKCRAGVRSLNVLPDFIKPGDVNVTRVWINGRACEYIDHDNFRIPLREEDEDAEVIVEFRSAKGRGCQTGQAKQLESAETMKTDVAGGDVSPHRRCAGL